MTTIAAALAEARERSVAGLDAQVLLARLLATTRTGLIAADDRRMSPEQQQRWTAWLTRRAAGEPLAYLLGEKEFHGLLLEVTADVLVPRPETELLVDWAAALLSAALRAPAEVADLGTGSGAIALAIKHCHPAARVTATDVSPAALGVARRNAARLGLDVELVAGSWWRGLEQRRFDLVVANPPYIAEGDPHLEDLRHEPRGALTAGHDGMADLEAIAVEARRHLHDGGWLLLEHGFDQGDAVRALLQRAGLTRVETRPDLGGRSRASGGHRPGD